MITIFTDGSCSGNPGPGGFGVVVCEHNWGAPIEDYKVVYAYQEREDNTTNNRMEMKAIIWALENYGNSEPTVYSDSSYCVNSFTKWIQGWKANGWARAGGKKLENLDLIKQYDSLVNNESRKIDLHYIKGHAGKTYNEIADDLATGRISIEEVMKQYG